MGVGEWRPEADLAMAALCSARAFVSPVRPAVGVVGPSPARTRASEKRKWETGGVGRWEGGERVSPIST